MNGSPCGSALQLMQPSQLHVQHVLIMMFCHDITYSIKAPYLFLEWSDVSYNCFQLYNIFTSMHQITISYNTGSLNYVIGITSIAGFVKPILRVHPTGC